MKKRTNKWSWLGFSCSTSFDLVLQMWYIYIIYVKLCRWRKKVAKLKKIECNIQMHRWNWYWNWKAELYVWLNERRRKEKKRNTQNLRSKSEWFKLFRVFKFNSIDINKFICQTVIVAETKIGVFIIFVSVCKCFFFFFLMLADNSFWRIDVNRYYLMALFLVSSVLLLLPNSFCSSWSPSSLFFQYCARQYNTMCINIVVNSRQRDSLQWWW